MSSIVLMLCNYSGTPLAPPAAAFEEMGKFAGTPRAPAGGLVSPCTPSEIE